MTRLNSVMGQTALMTFLIRPVLAATVFAGLIVSPLMAQDTTAARDKSRPARDTARTLVDFKITAKRDADGRVPALQSHTLPVTMSTTAAQIQRTVNVVDTEDAVKYFPSVFLRKRNNGDTQAVMGTRVWGVSSSARSLIFADGVPLSALVANNNTIGAPRWGLVSPAEIARIDMMYGPFSAAYAGNSMGAVMEITTRLPEKLEGSITQTNASQRFELYGTRKSFGTSQTTVDIGNRFGKFAFWASAHYQDSHSQPLSYVTSATFPTGVTGGFAEQNKLGAAANVLGASGLLHTGMANGKLKLAYDITPKVRAAYTVGIWTNRANAGVESFAIRSSAPTYAGLAGFASGNYHLEQQHTSQSLSLRTDTRGRWDVEAVGTRYEFNRDLQRTPTSSSATSMTFGAAGRIASLEGTGWSTADIKASWNSGGSVAAHTVSFGAHYDRYLLNNPTYTTADWTKFGNYTGIATEGDGKTRTAAVWAQESWRVWPQLKLTVGGRFEDWRAYDGYNVSGTTKIDQPEQTASRFSPKASLAWTPGKRWLASASVGKAYRFATVAELYQLVSTGTTFTSPNSDLKPDDVLAVEVRGERRFDRGRVGISLFQDDVHDAIISQFLPLVNNSATLYSYLSNVDHVRARGAEFSFGTNELFLQGLELSGSATYLNARTLALSGRASATAPADAAIGKRLPNIPEWRATFATTYRPVARLSLTAAGRYSSKLYTTLDNADVRPNTYQGFSEWFVADARASYQIDRRLSASLGVDNVLNRKYFLFHPFPQRTVVGSLKLGI